MFSYFLFLLSPRILWSIIGLIGLSWSIEGWLGEVDTADNIGRVAFLSSKAFLFLAPYHDVFSFSVCLLTLLGLGILYSSSCFIYFLIHFFGGLFA